MRSTQTRITEVLKNLQMTSFRWDFRLKKLAANYTGL